MTRNFEIENRISRITKNDKQRGINSYGGMGLDRIYVTEKKLRYEELNYMRSHPELYRKQRAPPNDPSMYLLSK